MHLRRLANLWILLLVAAGLLLAPVAPAFARMMPDASAATMQAMSGHEGAFEDAMSGHAMSDHAMSDEAMSGQDMADNMPCCPDQTKSKGCDDCPFLALCMLSVPLAAPAAKAFCDGSRASRRRTPLRRATTVCLMALAPSLRIIRLEPTSDGRLKAPDR
jgi:hypothetical protein